MSKWAQGGGDRAALSPGEEVRRCGGAVREGESITSATCTFLEVLARRPRERIVKRRLRVLIGGSPPTCQMQKPQVNQLCAGTTRHDQTRPDRPVGALNPRAIPAGMSLCPGGWQSPGSDNSRSEPTSLM
ncbi:hypothetical protein Vafri_1551 [Volvox africanus]|nr:hypothetical protein Vafri_1551 [Volvox africanus]